jgi:hypothetical protein
MATEDATKRPVDSKADSKAYLEEQMARQKRGEPIDVEWVRAELERVRREQAAHRSRTQRNLTLLTIFSAALLLVLWVRNGGLGQRGGALWLGAILIGLLASWGLARRKR